ncbi:MAG TPA: alpha/beta fold hydrolase [Caldimonas sp.]|jgi:pimeloyl-ACP methyl ester carboxylesterase|nr:alpha/beta fold hydrolase [Caldimonas sp.]
MDAPLRIDGVDVLVEGEGATTVVMLHGWPDTHRLWDAQAASLKTSFRCVRFTLPGFESGQPRVARSLAQTIDLLRAVVDAVSPAQPVVLLLHDWGCFFGYQFAMRAPTRVAKIVGVDIGDARSPSYARSLTIKAKAMVVAYQCWLALAWRVGGRLGDAMTRALARVAHAPASPSAVHAGMNYPYDIRWTGSHGSYKSAVPFVPTWPMLFIYGSRKPFMFHSPQFVATLAARDDCRVLELETGHWVMTQEPERFNDAVRGWLGGA